MRRLRFLRHIGLKVPTKQLALAYYQTYGLSEDFSTRRGRRFNVRDYRFAVRTFIPRVAYAVTLLHRRHEPADPDTPEYKEMVAEAAALTTENNWDAYRRKARLRNLCAGRPDLHPAQGRSAENGLPSRAQRQQPKPTTCTALRFSITILRRMLEPLHAAAGGSGQI